MPRFAEANRVNDGNQFHFIDPIFFTISLGGRGVFTKKDVAVNFSNSNIFIRSLIKKGLSFIDTPVCNLFPGWLR